MPTRPSLLRTTETETSENISDFIKACAGSFYFVSSRCGLYEVRALPRILQIKEKNVTRQAWPTKAIHVAKPRHTANHVPAGQEVQ